MCHKRDIPILQRFSKLANLGENFMVSSYQDTIYRKIKLQIDPNIVFKKVCIYVFVSLVLKSKRQDYGKKVLSTK